MNPAGIFIVFAVIGFVIWIIARLMDKDRIEEYIRNQGGQLISKEWAPFGKGWLGDKSDRIYKVIYYDRDRNRHEAYVKTSMLSGVYFTEDKIVEYGTKSGSHTTTTNKEDALRREIEALKAELEALKKKG